ncbi:hypothetical protein SAMN05216464_1316 [Mucilaginibacter pineti]|uniref:Uncharacterized protein n=1 Tax=Mucilaginibacter pineti TaxID=1391627 RepID=A0A1G7NXZ2_9SPHI|nr:hypothetical protein SAMN05216464_1316 [Mucilaginibacter pineti]
MVTSHLTAQKLKKIHAAYRSLVKRGELKTFPQMLEK